jgi:outer membrane cobalamin receptor
MPSLNRHLSFLPLALACPAASPALAAEEGDTIVVTALRTPVEEQISSSITVLDQAAIERAQPLAISDLCCARRASACRATAAMAPIRRCAFAAPIRGKPCW